jgi:hypothetical protein
MDITSWPKKWSEASLGDITALWPKKWNEASLRDMARLPEFSRSRRWQMLGMLAVGLVAGAALAYAVAQRAEIKRLAMRARGIPDEQTMGDAEVEAVQSQADAARGSNHGRKATSEV